MPTMLHLDEDMIMEIFSWLPVKEVIKLRCVSKRYFALVSDPRFTEKHSIRNAHPSIASFFLCDNLSRSQLSPFDDHRLQGLPDPSLSFVSSADSDRISVTASCNGLIVCCQATLLLYNYNFRYYVCNPTTKSFVALPVPDGVGCYLSLVFDPSRSIHYKVVGVDQQIHVYSSSSCAWKLSIDKECLRTFGGFHVRRSVYWNGKLIWLGKECIMSFDVEEEKMRKLPIPVEPYDCSRVSYIGESGGKLQMIASSKDETTPTSLEILEIDSGCSRWSVLYRVDLNLVKDFSPCFCGSEFGQNYAQVLKECKEFSPLFFIGEGEEEGGLLLLSIPGKILSYNLNDKVLKKVCEVLTPPSGSIYCPYDWYKFYPLGHTLFSP